MNVASGIILITGVVLGSLTALAGMLLFVRLRWPAPVLWILKCYVAATSSIHAFTGALVMIIGWTSGSGWVTLLGWYNLAVFGLYIFRVTRGPGPLSGFEHAFGAGWKRGITEEQRKHFLSSRYAFALPSVPEPRLEQNVAFATIPGSDRKLLCDLWLPAPGVARSGLAVIYLHGSAFFFLDKDFGTRRLFRHLAAQGHVIMDVAYRLAPETDMMGMVHDVRRAIAWMKRNAAVYNVGPLVLAGGSAGGHLALLAAYTTTDPAFTPEDLRGSDGSVAAVASLYGSSDMEALYYHTNQHLTTRLIPGRRRKAVPANLPAWIIRRMGQEYHRLGFDKGLVNAGTLVALFGGHPDECPDTYKRYSVITHVHPACPPTYLIHGTHDILAPVTATRALFARLAALNLPAVMHILPQTDHGFDLVLTSISPAARSELYDLERFLAVQRHAYTQSSEAPTRGQTPELVA